MIADLIAFLRACTDEDERVAMEASRFHHDDHHMTPGGEHWQWVEPEHDQPLALDPALDEYFNDGGQAALRSVEQYQTGHRWTLPHFVVPYAEEVRTCDAMHIARWGPARVLAEVAMKRRLIDEAEYVIADARKHDTGDDESLMRTVLELLSLPYREHPHFRSGWIA